MKGENQLPDSVRRERCAALLREAAAAHHRAFIETDGADPDWPQWYAAYLAAPLAEALSLSIPEDALAEELAGCDREHRAQTPEADWPAYYAERLLCRY